LDAQRLDHIRYPHPCWKDVTGLTSDWVLAVAPAETMRLFAYWAPTDAMEYLGSLSGQDFVLAGRFSFSRRNPLSIGCATFDERLRLEGHKLNA
jgi:hypothetical protein